jgi:hypothetical protein
MQYRRSDYDVTNTVQVSSVAAVRRAVEELYTQTWPGVSTERLAAAFADFERLFNWASFPVTSAATPSTTTCSTRSTTRSRWRGCSRATSARMLPDQRLGAERGLLGIVVALFHDAGYIRQTDDTVHRNGAEFTRTHVGRSARFLARYLPTIGMAEWVPVATLIVHFTGYEMRFDQIRLDDPRDRKVGHLLGTADMMAQMADRCYLEKCRDRLYPEFVLGGVAVSRQENILKVTYGSGPRRAAPDARVRRRDDAHSPRRRVRRGLPLRRSACSAAATPTWRRSSAVSITSSRCCSRSDWWMLRRVPPCFTWEKNPLQNMRTLVIDTPEDGRHGRV